MGLHLSRDLIADRHPDLAHRLGSCSFHDLFGNDGEVFRIDFNGDFHSAGLGVLGLDIPCRSYSTLAANNLPHPRPQPRVPCQSGGAVSPSIIRTCDGGQIVSKSYLSMMVLRAPSLRFCILVFAFADGGNGGDDLARGEEIHQKPVFLAPDIRTSLMTGKASALRSHLSGELARRPHR